MISFYDKDLVPILYSFDQAANRAAFGLQTPRFGNVKFHVCDGDVGFSTQSLTNRDAGRL